MALTPQRQRFVEEYLVDLNATQAAILPARPLKARGCLEMLRNAKVGAEIGRLQAQRSERTQLSADRVVAELACIAFSDMRRFAKWGAKTARSGGCEGRQQRERLIEAAGCRRFHRTATP